MKENKEIRRVPLGKLKFQSTTAFEAFKRKKGEK
jgi:hypothetical protein